jgi:tRNA nucleotidyltransferase (CCA-adding enzyme)
MQELGKRIHPPVKALNILKVLRENGYEGYVVGGCVRDSVLGREPKDWDITTNAPPSAVRELFPKTVDTGLKHGTVTVMEDGEPFEVTTFRIDGGYSDGRRPDRVEFTRSLEEDLRRRDFTMNAMAWNEERGIVDPFGGMEDIASGIIRAVGEPEERFGEDSLRILRAVRFAARLDFAVEDATLKAAAAKSSLISNVSGERIREELTGILTSGHPGKLALLRDMGVLGRILPEVEACFHTAQNNPHHAYNVGEHSLRAVGACMNDKCLRWAMLLHDAGKAVTRTTDEKGIDHFYGHPAKSVELAKGILDRLRFDNRSADRILRLISHHDRDVALSPKAVAKAVNAVGEDIFTDLLNVKRADVSAQNPKDVEKGLLYVDRIEAVYNRLKEENACLGRKDLAINGDDLIGMGFEQGRGVGRTLGLLFEKVLENPALNKKECLTELAEELLLKQRGNRPPSGK